MLFIYYPGVKIKSSNLLVDMMQSIVGFKMSVLEESLRVSPDRRIFVTTASLNSITLQNITFDFVQKGHSFVHIGRHREAGSG